MTNIAKFPTVDQQGKRVIPDVSIETNIIVRKIREGGAEFHATYADISQWIGRDILTCRGYLSSARRILQREHGIVLETIRKVGVRVCTPDQKVDVIDRQIGSVRRGLGRAVGIADTVEYEKLGDEKKRVYIARQGTIGTMRLLSSPAGLQKVERAGAAEALPSAKVLALFQG